MNIYQEWNFTDNPFKTSPLPSEIEGEKLIVGREKEIRQLTRRLFNQPQIPTLEGLNGIGKTSIINVAIFRAFKQYLENEKNSTLFIPCNTSLQLTENITSEMFIDIVLREVAQTLIKYKKELKILNIPLPKNIHEIDKWLNSPFTKSKQGSFGLATVHIGGGENIETNTSTGFEHSGIRNIIKNWLKEIFPKENSGGIVCVIDNMELLEKSKKARKLIEELRDNLFNIHGIRWVMCGSLGIISSIVSSPRLEGLMHDPIEIKSILKMYLSELYDRRIQAYSINDESYLPITKQSFSLLYDILKWNIRNTLKYANDFCTWVADEELKPITVEEKENLFMEWIVNKSNKYYSDIKNQLQTKTIKLFTEIVSLEENISTRCAFRK